MAARAFSELYQNLQEGKTQKRNFKSILKKFLTIGIQFHTSFAALLETFNSKCEQFVNNRDAELAQVRKKKKISKNNKFLFKII